MSRDKLPRLNVCMLLPYRYEPDMLVYPRIKIFSHIIHFGHEVSWVMPSESGDELQQVFLDGIKVYVLPNRHYLPGNTILAKFVNEIVNTFRRMRCILKIFTKEKYDLTFVRGNVFNGLTAVYIKKRYKTPFVFELATPPGWEWESFFKVESKRPKILYYLVAKFDGFVATRLLYKADLILPVSKRLKEELVKEGVPQSKIMPIPEGVDIGAFLNRDGRRITEKYGFYSWCKHFEHV